MKTVSVGLLTLAVGFVWVFGAHGGAKNAETKVTLKRVHMCCGGCAKEVATILQKVAGVKEVTCDQKANTAQFTARNATVAQNALDALAANGFHGETGSTNYAFKNDSGVHAGKVTSLTLTGFHNSCPGCVRSFREVIKNVDGVTGDNLKSKLSTCTIAGNFDAVTLVEALNKGGFHVHVKN